MNDSVLFLREWNKNGRMYAKAINQNIINKFCLHNHFSLMIIFVNNCQPNFEVAPQ